MIPHVEEVKPLGEYKLYLRFSDGKEGEIDLKDDLWGEVFEPLKDLSMFQSVTIDSELKTITWPNGADFAPEYLYEKAS